MNVGLVYDGATLERFLTTSHPHIGVDVWLERVRLGCLAIDGRAVENLGVHVRAGNRLVHTIPQEIEPEVSVDLRFLYEDDALMVLSKPAPLAIHPCGRYNRNSLLPLLAHVFGDNGWRPVHRLDADTTGLLVLAKTPAAARHLGRQFEARTVAKLYLARIAAVPPEPRFSCDLAVTDAPGLLGKRSAHAAPDTRGPAGAFTAFEHIATFGCESLVTAAPSSGRTNQIRVHLAALGLPIVGDDAYSGNEEFTTGRTALCLHAWRLAFKHPDDDRPLAFEDQRPAWAQDSA